MKLIDKDGGPAFAAMAISPAGDVYHSEGMTLRDWFAGQAPAQPDEWSAPKDLLRLVARPNGIGREVSAEWDAYYDARAHNAMIHEVTWRWAYADAMLKARAATGTGEGGE
jgi:hypothetical protein